MRKSQMIMLLSLLAALECV